MVRQRYRPSLPLVVLIGLFAAGTASGQALVEELVSIEERRLEAARESQERIEAIVDVTSRRFEDWQATLKEVENLVAWNRLVNRQVEVQEQELRDLRTSISQVTLIERQILPLMTRMIDSLEAFIAMDIPFYQQRRRARVVELRELLTRADVTAAEQFRRVLEAWQTENDYGRYMDAYTGTLSLNGVAREVDFLKVGRIAFMYLTPDGSQAGVWDQNRREWIEISRDYHDEIRQGFEAYAGDVSKAIFMIPISPPEEGTRQ